MYKIPSSEPIAVVGSACRFAGGVKSVSTLWDLLSNPQDLSQTVPADRFDANAFYHPNGENRGTTNAVKGYFLDGNHLAFDAAFFNTTPREAESLDPQQRITLEAVYEAMESAGYTLHRYSGKRVSVFSGVMSADYDHVATADELNTSQYLASSLARSILSNRVSYFFNFQGPSMTIDTACSSSLVALHQAVQSLRAGESELACVTGTNLCLSPEPYLAESSLHMLSPTGYCRMWDQSADGYARGEGVAAILLKPLSTALRDDDVIHALVRETGVNQDGRTPGITVPNPNAQSALIRETYLRSGLDPTAAADQCQYFEAHGTGTQVGDPAEAAAISDAFFGPGKSNSPQSDFGGRRLLVGSVKTILGHTEGAAGLAGLLKTIQALQHQVIPANLHHFKLNPKVEPFCKHLQLVDQNILWPQLSQGQVARASINSFGFGGTNAHAVIERYEPLVHNSVAVAFSGCKIPVQPVIQLENTLPPVSFLPIVFSANSQRSLQEFAQKLQDYLLAHPNVTISNLAWNIFSQRTAFPFRQCISASSREELLENLAIQKTNKQLGIRAGPNKSSLRFLGVFTGQGAQWTAMSRGLLQISPLYRKTIQSLDAALRDCPHPPSWSLEAQIEADSENSQIQEAAVSQPLCTALQIGLIQVLRSLGVTFTTVVGHSSGEIAAAVAAGRLSSTDAILVAYYRGMFASLASGPNGEKGAMLAATISRTEAQDLCRDERFKGKLFVAAHNSPTTITVSGDRDAVVKVGEEMAQAKKFSRLLHVDTAYHSPHMTAPAIAYRELLDQICIQPSANDGTSCEWVSSVMECKPPTERDLAINYWIDNMVSTVEFKKALEKACHGNEPFDGIIELGPHPALKGPVSQTITSLHQEVPPYFSPLQRGKDDTLAFNQFLGSIWRHFGPNVANFDQYIADSPYAPHVQKRLSNLPGYQWDHTTIHDRSSRLRQQYHFRQNAPNELLGVRTRDDNEHELRWRSILRLDTVPWLEHHRFQGQPLVPAAAYISMAFDAARAFMQSKEHSVSLIHVQDVDIINGISVDRDSRGTEVLFALRIESHVPPGKLEAGHITASFTITSCPADGRTVMSKNVTGRLQIDLDKPSRDALPSHAPDLSETLPVDTQSFYKMMDDMELTYSGPFRCLEEIRRRYRYASARLKRSHPEDSSTLAVRPALLDACFHSAFLAFSFPGDNSLWTSFLPTKIDTVTLNVVACLEARSERNDELQVETHLSEMVLPSAERKSSFKATVDIFDSCGSRMIQVEGLTVAAFANTRPEDDKELYLRTVLERDPEDWILKPLSMDSMKSDPALAEECARVATLCLRKPLKPYAAGFTTAEIDGHELRIHGEDSSVDQLISSSKYASILEGVRNAKFKDMAALERGLTAIIEAGYHQFAFLAYIASAVHQIVHRYPQSRILDLTPSDIGISRYILTEAKIKCSMYSIDAQSYQVATHARSVRNDLAINMIDTTKGIEHADLASLAPFDLIIASTALLGCGSALRYVRSSMRPGAFLLLAGSSNDTMTSLPCADVFEDISMATLLHQVDNRGFTLIVTQAVSPEVRFIRQPLLYTCGDEQHQILFIGGQGPNSNALTNDAKELLQSSRHSISTRSHASFEEVSVNDASFCNSAIVTSELDQSTMLDMTDTRLKQLLLVLKPEMSILWVTCGAISKPEHASVLGFLRTIVQEIPNLHITLLDLERIDTGSARLVAENFLRAANKHLRGQSESGQILWVREREIFIKDGYRMIPRMLPFDAGNERFNSARRIVTHPVNTANVRATLISENSSESFNSYRLVSEQEESPLAKGSIQVAYSTLHPIFNRVGSQPLHLCLGHDTTTGELTVALSTANSSFIENTFWRRPLPITDVTQALKAFDTMLKYLIAEMLLRDSQKLPTVVLDADQTFIQCIECAANQAVAKVFVSERLVSGKSSSNTTFIHPRASLRQIQSSLPAGAYYLVDCSTNRRISELVQVSLPSFCKYARLMGPLPLMGATASLDLKQIWDKAVSFAVRFASTSPASDDVGVMPVSASISKVDISAFQVLDWKSSRNIPLPTTYLLPNRLFRPDASYLLVGLTRDFGQSLTRFFAEHGARYIVIASRNPNTSPHWVQDVQRQYNAQVLIRSLDVTDCAQVQRLKDDLAEVIPPITGVVNGAMVLDDRVFTQMTLEVWNRVMLPKTVGSKNLDIVFSSSALEFFIMTSSMAAMGGHAGQANYATANMYMNGLAAQRRERGLCGSVLNIGVIYGLGYLQRDRRDLYAGLERDGYPPVSERDVHHMFHEAIVAGRPGSGPFLDLTCGLGRYDPSAPELLSWQLDPRFSHHIRRVDKNASSDTKSSRESLSTQLATLEKVEDRATAILPHFISRLESWLMLPQGAVSKEQSIAELGVDSLMVVEVRSWIWKALARDVAGLKILGARSIWELCLEIAK